MQTLPELIAERNALKKSLSDLRVLAEELAGENARLRSENSELRSQLEWHPIGPEAPRPVFAPEVLPLGEVESPPPIASYVHNPHAFLDRP